MSAPKMESRLYQEECLEALRSAYNSGAKRALFVLATGLGKTYVAISFVRWLIATIAVTQQRRKPRVLVLCHQNTILSQLRDEFRKHMGAEYSMGILNSVEVRPAGPVDVLFASVQSMSVLRESFGPRYFDIIVVDEGHRSGANEYAKTVRYFKPKFRFAMTATPNRMDLKDIRALYGDEVYSLPLVEALARKLLPRIRYKLFLETKRTLEAALSGRRASVEALNDAFFDKDGSEDKDKRIVEEILRQMKEIELPKVLVFCQDIKHCKSIFGLLQAAGVRVGIVHSQGIPESEREARIARFRLGSGEANALDVLVARDVLNEGKDLPAVNLVAIVRSTGSLTIFEQQIGRGLRPGKEELVVLDFVANCERVEMLAAFIRDVRNHQRKWLQDLGEDNAPLVLEAEEHNGEADSRGAPQTDSSGEGELSVLGDTPSGNSSLVVEAGDSDFEVVIKDIVRILGEIREPWTAGLDGTGAQALRELAGDQKTLGSKQIAEGSQERPPRCPSVGWCILNLDPSPDNKTLTGALRAIGLAPSTLALRRTVKWTAGSDGTAAAALRSLAGEAKQLGASQIRTAAQEIPPRCPSLTWIIAHLDPGPDNKTLAGALRAIGLQPSANALRLEVKWTAGSDGTAAAALRSLAGEAKQLGAAQIDAGSKEKPPKCPSHPWVIAHLDPSPDKKTLAGALEAIGLKLSAVVLRRAVKWTAGSDGTAAAALRSLAGDAKHLGAAQIEAGSKERPPSCPSVGWCIKHLDPDPGKKTLTGALRAIGLEPSAVSQRKATKWTPGADGTGATALRKLAGESKRLSTTQVMAGSKEQPPKCPSVGWCLKHLDPSPGKKTFAGALRAIGLEPSGRGRKRSKE